MISGCCRCPITQSFRATSFEFRTGSIRNGETRKVRLCRATLRTCPRRTDQADRRHDPKRKSHLWTIRRAPGAGVSIRDEITDGSGKRRRKKKRKSTRGHKEITNHHSSGARDFGITASGIVARPGWPIYISTSRHEFDFLGPEWSSGPIPFRDV